MLIAPEENHYYQILFSRGFVWLFQTYIRVFKWDRIRLAIVIVVWK